MNKQDRYNANSFQLIQVDEIAIQLHSKFVTLLGVKLHARNILLLYRSRKLITIMSASAYYRLVIAGKME